MESRYRKGIEKEYWVLRKNERDYTALDVRTSDEFSRVLAECGGTWEYQWNVFELKTITKEEEADPAVAEAQLTKRLDRLIAAAKNIDKNAVVLSCGTYQGRDDPNIDTGESSPNKEDNAFWNEFNIACPADAFTRYTTADQLNISANGGSAAENIKLYNRIVGLSPLFIYCFSSSPCLQGISLDVWNRRQQLIDAKGIQSGHFFPGTYPLHSIEQYQYALERTGKEVEERLARFNPHFFCRNGKSPREIVAEYRGSEWSFFKLLTQQVVRFNQKNTVPGYLEIRCIDAQECTKITAGLSYMGESMATAASDLDRNLPQTEDELRNNFRVAVLFGDRATMSINGEMIPLPEYANRIAEILFDNDSYYSSLMKERFLNPPARELRRKLELDQDIVEILSRCLEKNKTIYEI